MAEYIDRQAAIDALTERNLVVHMDSVNDGLVASCHRSAQRIIANLPTADVRPVVRGKWRFEIGDGKTCVDGWVCSACNCGFHTNVPYFEGFNFCPNCGADMREEK